MSLVRPSAEIRTGALARNSAWNFAGFVATLGAHFVTIPVVVSAIGLAEFGKAGLVIAIWAPFVLIGTVIGQSALREVSASLGAGDAGTASRLAWTALILVTAAAGLTAVALLVAGPFLIRQFGAAGGSASSWLLAFAVYGAGWLVQQVGLVYQGIAAAAQNYRAIAVSSIATAVAMVGATVMMMRVAPTMESYLAGLSIGFLVGTAAWPFLVAGVRHTGGWAAFTRERSRLIHFGKWQGTNYVAAAFGNQVDRYVLAAIANPLALGQFNAANRLQEAAYTGLSKVTEVLFPYFGSMSHREHSANREVFLLASWSVALISGCILGPLVPLADAVLRAWVGGAVGVVGGWMLRTLVLGGIVGSGANVVIYYFLATDRARRIAILSVLFSAATIALAIVLISLLGPIAAGGAALAVGVVRIAVMLGQFRAETGAAAEWSELLIATALPISVTTGASIIATWLAPLAPTSWLGLGAAYAGYAVVFGGLAIFASMLFGTGRRLLRLAASSLSALARRKLRE